MRVGTLVRIDLHGRRVGAWVVEVKDASDAGRALKPIAKVTGWGPSPDVVDLCRWAAWRWAGRVSSLLGTASPPGAVRALPPPAPELGVNPAVPWPDSHHVRERGVTLLRIPPASDTFGVVLDAVRRGPALVLAPSIGAAGLVALRLKRAGVPVAVAPREWARAMAGGCTVVGARAAAFAPVPDLAAVVVLDEHDEGYAEERAPTWNARDVAVERASRAGVPCVLVSPTPSLAALDLAEPELPNRADERAGWPVLDVVDRRKDDPRTGLYSSRLVDALRSGKRVVCVLNRKGRVKLLACAACGELARCEVCQASVELQDDGTLRCLRCGATRPAVCAACGSTKLKALRLGVSRVREDLERLAGTGAGVVEVTADVTTEPPPADARILVGTEAVLHRVDRADVVAFLDVDQELLAPRYRAAEQAIALLARAARLVGPRADGGRLLVQTRLPKHEVLDAVLHADPGRVAGPELARRAALRFPPTTALALVSGAPAQAYVDGLPDDPAVERLGPTDAGAWLVRAPDHQRLCDALAVANRTRPPGRLRVEVDPVRA